MIQGSNKLKNYRLRWLSKPLRLAKFESFWIRVCAIVAVFGILGDISLLSECFYRVFSRILLWFSIFFSHENFLALFPPAFLPFYSVILKSQRTIDSSVLLPGYQSLFCARHLENWAFPCFLIFSFFWCCFFESPWLTFRFNARPSLKTCYDSVSWPFFFVIFPKWAEFISVGSKVFCCDFPFCIFSFRFPKVPFTCIMNGYF